jgi:hypothetical protein
MKLSWPEDCPWCGHSYDPHIFVAQSYTLHSLPGGQVARLPDVVTVQCPLPACDCQTTWRWGEKVPSHGGEIAFILGRAWHSPTGDHEDIVCLQLAVDEEDDVFLRARQTQSSLTLTLDQFTDFCDAVRANRYRHVPPPSGESQE